MTIDEFSALNLDASSHFLTIHLKGSETPMQPVKLRNPLPERDGSALLYTVLEGKKKRFSVVPYEFSGKVAYRLRQVELELVESIVEMPYIVRNSSNQKYL